MLSFREWYDQTSPEKPWKGKKKEILQYWQSLPPSIPIQPINIPPKNYKGPTTMFDGVRITGSHQFINSVASRLKDIINYDGGNTNLMLRYHQQVDKNTQQPFPNSFVFYAQVRGKDKVQ